MIATLLELARAVWTLVIALWARQQIGMLLFVDLIARALVAVGVFAATARIALALETESRAMSAPPFRRRDRRNR